MDITVLGKYKVEFKGTYSHRNEDYDFLIDSYYKIKTIFGDELIEIIANNLKDRDIIDFTVKDNVIHYSRFNTCTGENEDSYITILEEVKE